MDFQIYEVGTISNQYPFNKPSINTHFSLNSSPYTRNAIIPKSIPFTSNNTPYIQANPHKSKTRKYIFYIILLYIGYIIYPVLISYFPKAKAQFPKLIYNPFISTTKSLLSSHTSTEYQPTIVLFDDPMLDIEIRAVLKLNNQIPITTDHLALISGTLSLRNKRIKTIIGIENIHKIKGVDLSLNSIEYIPTFTEPQYYGLIKTKRCIFYKMLDLQYINLASNSINDIRQLYLKNIIRLDLSDNKIVSIKSISNLIHLAYLNLGNNSIEDIYPLTKLKKLNVLIIFYNKINLNQSLNNLKTYHYLERIKTKNKELEKFIYLPQKE